MYKIFFLFHINNGDYMNIDYCEALIVVPRCLLSMFVLFIITKLIGKKQVSELSLFDYVIGISIGNFIAEMTMNTEVQYVNGIIAMIVFGIVAYSVSIVTMKSMSLRRKIIGVPTIIIANGKIIEEGLNKVKMDINDLLEQCRLEGYFDLEEINYAIMEVSGKLSFLPKIKYKPVVMEDLKLNDSETSLSANIIIDGNFMDETIKNIGINRDKILKELKKKKIFDVSDVLLGTLTGNTYNFYLKNEKMKNYSYLE